MAGFTSPSILFLNTWDGPEREYNYRLLSAARQNGYDKLVELYAGGFANPIVAKRKEYTISPTAACGNHHKPSIRFT